MYKLIISDLDGTLVNTSKNISNYTKKIVSLLKDKDIHFVIATGRNYKGAKRIYDELGLKSEIICNNGSTIYDKNGELIYHRVLNKNSTKDILKKIIETDSIFFASYGSQIYVQKGKIEAASSFLLNPIENPIEVDLENIDLYDIEKIVILNNDNSKLENLSKIFNQEDDLNAFISQDFYLDVVHKDASKGKALKFLADLKNINLDHTLAFGDAFNDYEMLKFAGKGFVMPNGFAGLKKEFETLKHSNDEDGVAKYISKIFNKE